MSKLPDILIVGAGIFGLAAAHELQTRGYGRITVLDPGPIPHPLAASTDISKAIRMAYGPDEQYLLLAAAARDGWLRWNEQWGETLYHEWGVTMLTREPMAPGGFEYESYHLLHKHRFTPERLDGDEIIRRFPGWQPGRYVDGFYDAQGGWAESGRVITTLAQSATNKGIDLQPGHTVNEIIRQGGRAIGVRTQEGDTLTAGEIIVCAGTWSQLLLPELQAMMHSTGHPVFHLRPPEPALWQHPHFTVFTADISRTGWYGFPWHPQAQVVKIANHGIGQRLHPVDEARVVVAADELNLRTFLQDSFPELAAAPIVYTRRCCYSDTLDGHFWIDRHPEVAGLTVAAGGSGHAFKFAPVLGGLVADRLEGKPNPFGDKFRWRTLAAATQQEEAARYK
ncbi:MAG: FAD-dependent oxidoreductase [Anaerolineae bacterium]|nr:FAD-dependent oxidoreductase [Anaerolineae bacterium]